MRFAFIQLLILIVTATGLSAEPFDYHRTYRSPYYLGRGDTGISVADEQHVLFYNPAGIAQGKGIYKKTVVATPTIEGSMAARDLARRISIEKAPTQEALRNAIGQPQHFGASLATGVFLRRAALGGSYSVQGDVLVSKDRQISGFERVDIGLLADQVIAAAIGEKFFIEGFTAGLGLQIIKRRFMSAGISVIQSDDLNDAGSQDSDGIVEGDGVGINFGMMYRSGGVRPYSFGLTVENVGNTNFTPQVEGEYLAPMLQTVNFGMTYEPGTKFSKMRLLVDYRDILNAAGRDPFINLHVGAEISLNGYLGFMTGLHDGYYCGGAYLDIRFIRFDLGAYTKEAGEYPGHRPDKRFYFQLSLAI
ncbi:hypothetical protein N9D31_02275 [Oligoflexaceae bacterium]|nr:hypothetical protein [Oligoflexaceae bacterium]